MPRYTYSDPSIAATAQNLASIFAGPDVAKEAQVAAYMANAGKTKAETGLLQDQLGARQGMTPESLAGLFAALPPEMQQQAAGTAVQVLRGFGGNADQAASGLQGLAATFLAAQPRLSEDAGRQSLVLQGVQPGKDTYITSAGQGARVAGDNAADYRKATSVAGIGAAAQRYNADRDYDAAIYGYDQDAARPIAVDGSLLSPLGQVLATAPVRTGAGGRMGTNLPELTPAEAKAADDVLFLRAQQMFPGVEIPQERMADAARRFGVYQVMYRDANEAAAKALEEAIGPIQVDTNEVGLAPWTWANGFISESREIDPAYAPPPRPQLPMPTYAQPAAAPAAPAAKPPVATKPAAASAEQLIAEANSAIERGADPVKVRERLKKLGVQLQE